MRVTPLESCTSRRAGLRIAILLDRASFAHNEAKLEETCRRRAQESGRRSLGGGFPAHRRAASWLPLHMCRVRLCCLGIPQAAYGPFTFRTRASGASVFPLARSERASALAASVLRASLRRLRRPTPWERTEGVVRPALQVGEVSPQRGAVHGRHGAAGCGIGMRLVLSSGGTGAATPGRRSFVAGTYGALLSDIARHVMTVFVCSLAAAARPPMVGGMLWPQRWGGRWNMWWLHAMAAGGAGGHARAHHVACWAHPCDFLQRCAPSLTMLELARRSRMSWFLQSVAKRTAHAHI